MWVFNILLELRHSFYRLLNRCCTIEAMAIEQIYAVDSQALQRPFAAFNTVLGRAVDIDLRVGIAAVLKGPFGG